MSDTAPDTKSAVTDHPFEPRDRWWSVCKHCGIAEAAHLHTTQPPGGWPPDKPSAPAGDDDHGKGPEPELPPASTHEVNLLDVQVYGSEDPPS